MEIPCINKVILSYLIFKANIHDMVNIARIRIRRLCSVVLFITGKENICSFMVYPAVKP